MSTGRSVLIGMPLAPSYQADVRIITMLEAWNHNEDAETFYVATPHAELGRDRIVIYAQRRVPKPSHILFVDHDVLPRYTTLKKLLAHDKDVVAGIYPLSQQCGIAWCLSREEKFKALPINDLPNNLFKVTHVGCGMMLVKTEVFDNLEWPYWCNGFVYGKKTIGEDVYFCKKLREAGYDIWVDPKIKCGHFRAVDLLGVAMNYVKGNVQ